ncbi:hypothetical protein OQA88_7774 [Cercophora sp. LCS_1]
MSQYHDISDPFVIPNFWKPSAWLKRNLNELNANDPFFSLDVSRNQNYAVIGGEIKPIRDGVSGAAAIDEDGFFRLPPILRANIQKQAGYPEDAVDETETDSDAVRISDDDMWLGSVDGLTKTPGLKSWDNFSHDDLGTAPPAFLTEAGPVAFDSLLSWGMKRAASPSVADAASYSSCLLSLALGRNSLLFSWDPDNRSFAKTASHIRASGFSLESTESVDKLCLECADATRQLQSFTKKIYSTTSTPTRVALAGATGQLVLAVQSELNTRGCNSKSILQLQSVVRPAHAVLTYFGNLVEKLARQSSDEGMLSCLFQEAQSAEYRSSLLQEVTREALRLVSKPWADFVEEWVGLKAEEGIAITKSGSGKGFVKVATKAWIDDLGYDVEEIDYFFDEDKMPSFMPEDIARTTFEAGRNLRFLREHHPDHPLSKQNTYAQSEPPPLEWRFDWHAMTQLEANVGRYSNALSSAVHSNHPLDEIKETPVGSDGPLELFGKTDAQIGSKLLASMDQFSLPLSSHQERAGFFALIRKHLYLEHTSHQEHPSPHWSLVPLLSFGPVIEAQSRIVNQECMKALFRAHQLRMHINLLNQYYLLDNGILCSRLSHALFDPELETAERKAGIALGGGTMGLRLGGRENWPPASSELRLALMGVLSESYQAPPDFVRAISATMASRSFNSDLPGDLSFAVRDLSPEEIDRCVDPDSLEALDFLRLSYKAPSPLRPVITPNILVKYDRIFMTLLRVLRMLYVVNQLVLAVPLASHYGHNKPSDASLRFCIEARHFVHQIAAYFFDTGVRSPWRRFETWLDEVEKETLADGDEAAEKKNHSPDVLRDRQEQTLDEILTVLLLRKRQAPVLNLLEETFTVVLRFAKTLRARGGEASGEASPEKLYSTFRRKVEVFLTVCKGLGEKTGAGSKAPQGGDPGRCKTVENPVEQLLLRLDMAGFYVRKLSV